MKRLLPVLAFILSLFSTALLAGTTPNTAIVSGTWELGTHWSAGHAPTNTEDAIVPAGMVMTINAADICASLTIGSATNTAASVTVVGANSLTLTTAGGGTGNLTMNPSNVSSAITLAAAGGTITIPGTLSSGGNKGGTISVSTGTLSFTNAGAWTWADAVNLSITGTGTASFAGALTMNSSSTTNFIMSAAGHLTFTGLLTQNAATYTISNTTTAGTINFNGGYNLIAGIFSTLAAETINFGGSFTSSLAGGLVLIPGCNTIFTGTATITPASAITFGNLQINAGATVTLAGNILVAGATWTNNGGTFNPSTYSVTFNGAANQSITGTAATQTFYDLILNLTAGKALTGAGSTTTLSVHNFTETTGNFTPGTISTLTINGNCLISAGVFATIALETINFGGSLNNAAALTFNTSSTEIFTNSSTITPGAALTFGIVQINAGSTVVLAGNILVAGATWTNNGGTFTPATYSVTFNGANNQAITGTTATHTFYDLIVNLTAGKTLSGAGSATTLAVNNYTETTGNFSAGTITTLTINGNALFTAGTCTAPSTVNALGNWTNNGGTYTPGTGVVNFMGAAAQAINGTAATQTFYDVVETLPAGIALTPTATTLTFNNFTETTGNFTASGVTTLNINANLSISAGTFTGAQTGASNTNVSGNITNAGAFSTTGTLLFSGALSSTVSGAGTWTLGGTGMTKTLKTTTVDIQLAAFITAVNTGGDNFTFTGGTWKFNTAAATYTDVHNKGTTTALTIGPNAVLEVDQGTVNLCANGTSNNVLLEGMLNMLGGTTNVQQGQALNTGSDLRYKVVGGVAPQLYITTGAIMNLGAGFNPTAGTDYIDFNMTGGTINMCTNGYSKASTLLFNDVVGGKTVMTAGTIVLQDACNASATDLDMGNGNINPYTVTGGTIQFGNASTPAGSTFYAITANPLTNYPNISTAGPVAKNVKSWNAGTINLLSLDINTHLTFDISAYNNNINFMGSNGTFTLNHSGTFIIGTGTFTFSGASTQVIQGTSSQTFGNIVINNTGGGVFLGVAETMTGTLTLTNGILNTLPGNTLTITATGGATAGSATSFVDGPMAKIGNTAFVFPLGNGTKYARLGISAPSASTTMTAQYYHTGYPYYPGNLPLATVSGYEYWTLGEAAASTVNVTLYWEDSVASGTSTYDNTLRVAHFNGASWDDKGQTAISTSGISGNITSVAVSNFSPFTFGSTNVKSNPLPVELLSFDAKAEPAKEVDVSWSTASETNCDYYYVERSRDGSTFQFLSKIKGAGNSTSVLNYKTVDPNPLNGTSYYRLTQTDFNGKSKTFSPVAVDFEGDKTFAIFPNPNSVSSPLYLKMDGATAGEDVLVVLYSEVGRELYSKIFITSADGLTNIGEALGSNISPGIYFITATSQNGIYKQKLLIK